MSDRVIVSALTLDDAQKSELVNVFVDSFAYMFPFTNKREDLVELFSVSLDYSMMYACMCDGKVGGILGIGTNKKRTTKTDESVCCKLFGNGKGKVVSKIMRMMCEKPAVKLDTDLYIDYVATSTSMRGQGIGTMLLEYTFAFPEYKDNYLEVLSKNTNAKKLYERFGYRVIKKKYITKLVLGDGSYIIKMKRQYPVDNQ